LASPAKSAAIGDAVKPRPPKNAAVVAAAIDHALLSRLRGRGLPSCFCAAMTLADVDELSRPTMPSLFRGYHIRPLK